MNKGMRRFLWLMGVPMVLCVILAAISAVQTMSCSWPLAVSCLAAFVFPILVSVLYLPVCSEKSQCCKILFIYIGMFLTNASFFYSLSQLMLAANSERCAGSLTGWVEQVHWVMVGAGSILIVIPSVSLMCYHFVLLHQKINSTRRRRDCIKKLISLYDPSCNKEDIFSNLEVRVYIDHLSLQKEEVEEVRLRCLYLKEIASANSSRANLDDSVLPCESQTCSLCRRTINSQSYIILPGCNHVYDEDCFIKHFTENEPYCTICNANVRRSMLKSIHQADFYLYNLSNIL